MIKNAKDANKNKLGKLNRSRSKSIDKSKGKLPLKNVKKEIPKTSRDNKKQKNLQNPSLVRSQSKKSLKKSKS